MWTVPRVMVQRAASPAHADFGELSSLASLVVVRLDVVPLPPRSGKRAAGGMSGDHDRCFSILVLGAFSSGVFNTNALPRINIGADVWGESSIMTGVY